MRTTQPDRQTTRRRCLRDVEVQNDTNAGLWFDKYLLRYSEKGQDKKDKTQYEQDLITEAAGIPQPSWYREWFERWKNALADCGAECREARVMGRMVVGLGDEGVLETSVTLSRTLGVPFIPGSALKGMASSFANRRLGEEWRHGNDSGAHSVMFGGTDLAGRVVFFDAMPLPGESTLHFDIMTPHHPDYQKDDGPPSDWDDPIPVPFVSTSGRYLVAVSGPEPWALAALEILAKALQVDGIGAKTSSGYGRLELQLERPKSEDELAADRIIQETERLANKNVAGRIETLAMRALALENPRQKKKAAVAIVDKVKTANRERRERDKSWYKDLLRFIE